MTIRSGGRPRDGRATQARPYDQDAYATETVPEFSEPVPRGRDGRGGGSGGGLPGFLKFLIFALVLAAIVLVVALTALRPMVNGAIMGIAEDNPAALRVPFVRDIVREDLGHGADGAGLDRPVAGRVPRRSRATPRDDREPPRGRRASSPTAARSSSSRSTGT